MVNWYGTCFHRWKNPADRSAMLIIKVKRINSNIKIMVLAEDEIDKTRVLEYGADEFAAKPISVETIVDKVYSILLTRNNGLNPLGSSLTVIGVPFNMAT